jgi:molybdopterin/thiamine biosynthesis adenylyltransferase
MKMLIIGAGGVGSWFAEELLRQIENGQLRFRDLIDIADNDVVEIKQVMYQNFRENEVGENKAIAIAKRCKAFGEVEVFRAIPERIEREEQLKGYDFFVLCADNERTRELVIKYCHENKKEFIDLRANGRRIFAMPKVSLKENLKFVDEDDGEEYSCQDEESLKRKQIDVGNKIVAYIGVQMLLNFFRNKKNKIISLIV